MWDAVTGTKQYTFEGHEAPVYSVCTHHKENIQVLTIHYKIIKVSMHSIVLFFVFFFFSLWEENNDFGFNEQTIILS